MTTSTEDLIAAVREMREQQRAWFGGDKRVDRLQAARSAERVVDRMLAELAAAPPPQGDLFGGQAR